MKIEKFVVGQTYSLEDILDSFFNAEISGLDNDEESTKDSCEEHCCCKRNQECEDNKVVLQMYAQMHSDAHDDVISQIKKCQEKLAKVDEAEDVKKYATRLRRLCKYRDFLYDITLDLLEEVNV